MPISQLFKVATEFRFEVGSALLGASQLERQVQNISSAADNTLISFQRLGLGIAANLGIGPGGAIGLFQKAIQSSEKFKDQQLKISQIFAANREKFIGPVDDFNSRLSISEAILKRVASESAKFSLPEGQLANQTALLSAQLSSKGLAGNNLGNAVEIGRDFLKSAPVLGVNPGQAQNQLLSVIEGSATGNNTLFRRLSGETDAFKEFTGNAKKFNQLKPHKRVELLRKALRQFTSQSDEVKARTELLTNRFMVMSQVFSGLDGIIKPIGDVLGPIFSKLIGDFTSVLDGPLRQVFLNASDTIKLLVPDVETLTINLLQLREAARDTSKAIKALGIIGIIGLIAKFGFLFRIIKPLVAILGSASGFLIGFASKIGLVGMVFKGLGFIATQLLKPFLLLFAVFQIISRARAIAKVKDLKALPELLAKFSAIFNQIGQAISNILFPITELINFFAELISPLFQVTFFAGALVSPLQAVADAFSAVGNLVLFARAGLEGLSFVILQFIDNVKNGKFLNLTDGLDTALVGGFDSFIEKNGSRFQLGGDGPTANNVTNIGKVEIKNEFRENQEPDRIAFSLTKQLLKTAQAPTQARGRSFNRGAASGAFGGQ